MKLLADLDEVWDQGVDRISFADGTTWTRADLRANLLAQASTSGSDSIVGFNVADTIVGGSGADTLRGAAAADVFRFSSLTDSPVGGADVIADFAAGSDKIDLIGIDANSGTAGDQAFVFIGSSAFSNVAGQLRVDTTQSGIRILYGDVNGDSVADLEIRLTGTPSLQGSDFLL